MVDPIQSSRAMHSISSPKKRSVLKHHVSWLRGGKTRSQKIGRTALLIAEMGAATLLLAPIFLVVKYANWLKEIQRKKDFLEKAGAVEPPSSSKEINIKSPTESFNHVQEFVIKEGILWERPRGSDQPWTPIYFDGEVNKRVPCSIDCDGANLIVLDQNNDVHYKKVIREYRGIELGRENENSEYFYVNKAEKMNWKDKWFSLPVAHGFHNLIFGKRLKIDPSARAWAISHRGRYNDYFLDGAGFKHFANIGVTTLYTLDAEGKKIQKFDPYASKIGSKEVPFPETRDTTYTALNLKAAASTPMLIGYERTKGESVERVMIKTRLSDIDTEGWNPILKYTYFPDEGVENKVLVLPISNWQSHPLDLQEGEQVSKEITITQTGIGSEERGLYVTGTKWVDGVLQPGRYFKKISDEDWQFEVDETLELPELLPTEIEAEGEFHSGIKDYATTFEEGFKWRPLHAKDVKGSRISVPEGDISIESFGENNPESPITMTIGNETFELRLFKRKSLKHFLGAKGWNYELVIPREYKDNPQLQSLLGKKNVAKGVIPINVQQSNEKLKLQFRKFALTLPISSE